MLLFTHILVFDLQEELCWLQYDLKGKKQLSEYLEWCFGKWNLLPHAICSKPFLCMPFIL